MSASKNSEKVSTEFFREALKLAQKAASKNEVPIGAVIVKDGKIIARAFNSTERHNTFTAHAEMICLQRASRALKTKYLEGCQLFITLEPCKMCETAARLCRIESIHYLLHSEKFGKSGKGYRKVPRKAHFGAMRDESAKLLADFFQRKR